MLRILIVDDEEIIRNGIAQKIERLIPEAEVVGKAGDPAEAMSLLETTRPNVILTDIRMPEIDGLQFIELVKEKYQGIKFVLISGYQEFEYARKGIELGTEDYLLKPVENEQLKKVLEKIRHKIEFEITEANYLNELKTMATDGVAYAKNKYLTDIIHYENEFDINHIVKALEQIDIRFLKRSLAVITILFDLPASRYAASNIKRELCKIAEEIFDPVGLAVAFENLKKENQVVVILNSETTFESSDLINLGNRFLKRTVTDLNIAIGIGKSYDQMTQLHDSYLESYTAAIQKVMVGGNKVIHIKEVPGENRVTYFIPEVEKQLLVSYITAKNPQGAIEIVDKIFNNIKTEKLSYRNVKTLCMEMSIILGKLVKEAGSNLENIFTEDIFAEDYLAEYKSLEALKTWLTDVIKVICGYLTELNKSDGKKVVREIKEYISNYYYVDINLNELARKYFMNSSYLSQLFKNETGEKFVDYHTRVRIEKAKELLLNTPLTSAKIAEMVGYANARYFSEIFVRYMGLTPSKFREKSAGKAIS